MTGFDFAAAIKARPGGDMTAELVAAYGNPEGPGAGPSNQGPAWFRPSPTWVKANLVTVPLADLPGFPPLPDGRRPTGITLHRLVAPVLVGTWAEVVAAGLADKLRTYNGSFAPRHMGTNRSRPLSVHAFGAAIDFDAVWNGYGVPLERMQINREVVKVFESCGWEWGGRWSDPYEDGMHFQWTDPLRGVIQASWRDSRAFVRPSPPPSVDVSFPTPPAPAAPTPPAVRYLYSRNRTPYGVLRDDWTSIAVDAQGRVLLGPDGQPRTVYMSAADAAAKGLS